MAEADNGSGKPGYVKGRENGGEEMPRFVTNLGDFQEDEVLRRNDAGAPEIRISDGKPVKREFVTETVGGVLNYLSGSITTHASRHLGNDSSFRKALETGAFKTPPDPEEAVKGLIEHVAALERNQYLDGGYIEGLKRQAESVRDGLLDYFAELNNTPHVKDEWKIIQRASPMGKDWELIVETPPEEEGIPGEARAPVYKVNFGDDPLAPLWLAAALTRQELEYGMGHRVENQQTREARDMAKAKGRIERLAEHPDELEGKPSLVIDLREGRVDGGKISREMKLLGDNALERERRKDTIIGQLKKQLMDAVNIYFWKGRKPRKAEQFINDPRVLSRLDELNQIGENALGYILITEKLGRLRNALSKDGRELPDEMIIDALASTVTELREEMNAYRGMSDTLDYLVDSVRKYSNEIGMEVEEFSARLDGMMAKSGGSHASMFKVWGDWMLKVLGEATRRYKEIAETEVGEEKLRADELEARLRMTEVDVLSKERRLKVYEAEPGSTSMLDARRELDKLSGNIDRVYKKFGQQFRVGGKYHVANHGNKGDMTGAVRKFRLHLENLLIMFDSPDYKSLEKEIQIENSKHKDEPEKIKERPGKYMIREFGRALGIDFEAPNAQGMVQYFDESLKRMKEYVGGLVKRYAEFESMIEDVNRKGALYGEMAKGLPEL